MKTDDDVMNELFAMFKGKGNWKGTGKGHDIKCFNCQGFGHMSRECESKKFEKGGSEWETLKGKGKGAQCLNCSGFGHFARDCSSKGKGKGKGKGPWVNNV